MAFVIAAWLAVAPTVQADPLHLSYGGRLTDSSGAPLAGPVDLSFSFFAAETGGAPLGPGPVVQKATPLSDGVFQADLALTGDQWHAPLNC